MMLFGGCGCVCCGYLHDAVMTFGVALARADPPHPTVLFRFLSEIVDEFPSAISMACLVHNHLVV